MLHYKSQIMGGQKPTGLDWDTLGRSGGEQIAFRLSTSSLQDEHFDWEMVTKAHADLVHHRTSPDVPSGCHVAGPADVAGDRIPHFQPHLGTSHFVI